MSRTVLVTGSEGFIGKHIINAIEQIPTLAALRGSRKTSRAELEAGLDNADAIVHLAGANRPLNEREYHEVNVGLTEEICSYLLSNGRSPTFIYTSSIQATLENEYGRTKRAAEDVIRAYSEASGASAVILRLHNVFGKWCRPHYNSVVATFCHEIARSRPIAVHAPDRALELVYIDDVVASIAGALATDVKPGCSTIEVGPRYTLTLGELAARIQGFRHHRASLQLPDFADPLNTKLYATYLSYLEPTDFAYPLERKSDARGSLAEFVKSTHAGQVFVSRTLPGITRGNHYHHTKTEKFLVMEGQAVIEFRHIGSSDIVTYEVDGKDYKVLDIPPGYTHSITNVGSGDLVVLFWASEVFDPSCPDTTFEVVRGE